MIAVKFSLAAAAVGSQCDLEGSFDKISTDTRDISPGCMFIAVKGERFDGNDFAADAVASGAACALVERDCGLGLRQIIVPDTRKAMLQLAGFIRNQFDIPVIGVTGSVGKTSTKEMIALVMSSKFKTLKNTGNLNNEIGVPKTVFEITGDTQAAVIEMGMNHFGEISALTRAIKPTTAVISNVGVSHIENLGSREGILKAKLEITEGMPDGAPLIINADNDMLKTVRDDNHRIVTYGIEGEKCMFRAVNVVCGFDSVSFDLYIDGENCGEISVPSGGKHTVYNALAATAAGVVNGIKPQECAKALKGFINTGMRQKIARLNGITFIEDCYNASPDSQKAAMQVLGKTGSGRKIAVIGDMLELGDYSETAHKNVGLYAAENGVDILFSFGRDSEKAGENAKNLGVKTTKHFTDKNELADELFSIIKPGDAVLFKASRGMKLEEVISRVYKSFEHETAVTENE
ncbi:MAG: UDP-N-acetylmuramoyl-tripeptide--D-alanyl-D-alanine ligase [Clostridiales bacterium]|nr:UDP-N-acetylmuramoyl-tripeptide--D-alanyl-D-alanine ligase [Clostridiales bacterium]